MSKIPQSLLLLLLLLHSVLAKDNSFDIFILTQHWPLTTCMGWKEHDRSHTCNIPDNITWGLHGLWPTRRGEIAPNYCNNSAIFDPAVLEPIMDDMNRYWPDVEIRKKKDSLWQHEWIKHGTCAAQLPQLDSELKYFSKGCELGKEVPLLAWLAAGGVTPGGSYKLAQVWEAVTTGTGGLKPHIDCDWIEHKHYLSEIKICFDKSFAMVDCDGIIRDKNLQKRKDSKGTCPRHGEFVYPSMETLDDLYGSWSFPAILGGSLGGLVVMCALLTTAVVLVWRSCRADARTRGYEAI